MKRTVIAIAALITLIVVYSSYYIVNETQQVVVTRFGKPVSRPISHAGMYFKIPVIDTANLYEKRILEWDGDISTAIPTKDKKNIIVDATARWRITDPLVFLQSVGSEEAAQTRLDDIIDSNLRDTISKHQLIEIVRNSNRVLDVINREYLTEKLAIAQDKEEVTAKIELGRDKITREILKKSQPIIEKYGIELIDVRIKGLMYSQAVLETVYKRMISQYDIKAQNLRSEGDKKKAQIEGEMELEIKQIRSNAYKEAQTIRGEGDAQSTKTYADAYKVNPNFYQFQKSLEAYEHAIDENTTLIMGTDSEFYKVLKEGSLL